MPALAALGIPNDLLRFNEPHGLGKCRDHWCLLSGPAAFFFIQLSQQV
jgi:hypothetical protein